MSVYLGEDRVDINLMVTPQAVFDFVYPVGSIYMSVSNVNPSLLFGGTWVAWGAGCVPVGVDPNDSDFDTVEATGGEKTHTLTTAELPEVIKNMSYTNPKRDGYLARGGYTIDAASMNITEGQNQPHNNLQPYITCYMWKRTA